MRSVCILVATVGLLLVGGCSQHDLKNIKPDPCIGCTPWPIPIAGRSVDLLFVVDNSGGRARTRRDVRRVVRAMERGS